jgi:pSer/pThr/pTyr-binding forkhead associated (FHA) protein
MVKLILKFQDKVIKEFEFDKDSIKFGRRDDNDIIVDNMAVSGHHARIDKETDQDGREFFVLEDLESLNGTFLNQKKCERGRVFDGDTVMIGKHVVVFHDLRPVEDRPKREDDGELPSVPEFRETVMLDAKAQQELLARESIRAGKKPDEPPPEKIKHVEFSGTLTILSGGVPEIIDLNQRLTKLGKAEEADVKCSGLLVGNISAVITKRHNGYFMSHAEGLKKPTVNGESVTGQVQLRDGDEIVIGSTRMTFNQAIEEVQSE